MLVSNSFHCHYKQTCIILGELVGKIPLNERAEFLEIQDDVLAVGGEDNIDIYKIKF